MENNKLCISDLNENEQRELQLFLMSIELKMNGQGQIMDSDIRAVMEECFLHGLRRRPLQTA